MKHVKFFVILAIIYSSGALAQQPAFIPGSNTVPSPEQMHRLNQHLKAASNPGKVDNYYWNGVFFTWDYGYTTSYTYNADGLVTEALNTEPGQNSTRAIWTYDSAGRMLAVLAQRNESNQWENIYTFEWEYDPYGHLLKEVRKSWDGTGWDTMSRMQNLYVLNAANQVTERVMQTEELGDWVNKYKTTYALDADGFPTEIIKSQWYQNAWAFMEKHTDIAWHAFDMEKLEGSFSFYIYHDWNGVDWDTLGRETFQYDSFGGYVSIQEGYNGGAWFNLHRLSKTHDQHTNFIHFKEEDWISWNNTWQLYAEYGDDLTYDMNNNLVERISKAWDSDGDTMRNEYRYVYSDFPVGISLYNEALHPFPNPVKDRLTLHLYPYNVKEVYIYNSLGQEVAVVKAGHEIVQADLSHLLPGLYIIRAKGSGCILNGTFIKE